VGNTGGSGGESRLVIRMVDSHLGVGGAEYEREEG
jgi:hypothetical protein